MTRAVSGPPAFGGRGGPKVWAKWHYPAPGGPSSGGGLGAGALGCLNRDSCAPRTGTCRHRMPLTEPFQSTLSLGERPFVLRGPAGPWEATRCFAVHSASCCHFGEPSCFPVRRTAPVRSTRLQAPTAEGARHHCDGVVRHRAKARDPLQLRAMSNGY